MASPQQTPYLHLNLDGDAELNRNWALVDDLIYRIAAGVIANAIAPGTITQPMLAKPSVGTPELVDQAVTSNKIADGTIQRADISATIPLPPSYTLPADQGKSLTIDNTGTLTWAVPAGGVPSGPASGDLTGSYPAPTIAPLAVTDAKIAAVAYAKVTGAPWTDTPATSRLSTTNPRDLVLNKAARIHFGTPSVDRLYYIGGESGNILDIVGSTSILFYPAGYGTYYLGVDNTGIGVNGGIALFGTPSPVAGTLGYQGGHFQGYNGSAWVNLDYTGGSGGPPSGPAGGDLAGSTYPDPVIAPLAVTNAKIASLAYSKLTGAPTSLPPSGGATGDLTGSYPGPTIANGVVTRPKLEAVVQTLIPPNPQVPQDQGKVVTCDATGNAVWSIAAPAGTAGGSLTGSYPNPTVASQAITNAMLGIDSTRVAFIQAACTANATATTTAVQFASLAVTPNGRYVRIDLSATLAVGVVAAAQEVTIQIRRDGVGLFNWTYKMGAGAATEFPLPLGIAYWDPTVAGTVTYSFTMVTSSSGTNVHTHAVNPGLIVISVWR